MFSEKKNRDPHICIICGFEIGHDLVGIGLENKKRLAVEKFEKSLTWFCEPCIVKKLIGEKC